MLQSDSQLSKKAVRKVDQSWCASRRPVHSAYIMMPGHRKTANPERCCSGEAPDRALQRGSCMTWRRSHVGQSVLRLVEQFYSTVQSALLLRQMQAEPDCIAPQESRVETAYARYISYAVPFKPRYLVGKVQVF
jgi:hypothetical protein